MLISYADISSFHDTFATGVYVQLLERIYCCFDIPCLPTFIAICITLRIKPGELNAICIAICEYDVFGLIKSSDILTQLRQYSAHL